MTEPTQTRWPWRAVLRTTVAVAFAVTSLAPEIAVAGHIPTNAPVIAQCMAVAAAVTRILAVPGVERFLQQYAPWLSAQPPAQPPNTGGDHGIDIG